MDTKLILPLIHEQAIAIQADGILDHISGDGERLFEICRLVNKIYQAHDRTKELEDHWNGPLDHRIEFIEDRLKDYDDLYGWDHKTQDEATEDRIYRLYAHMYVVFKLHKEDGVVRFAAPQ